MTDGEAYWQVLSPVWEAVSIYEDPDRFQREFEAIPVVPRNLLAAHWCQSEVCNGGFHQFFSNSTGVLAPEAVVAFRALGLLQLAETVAQAAAWFGERFPREREERQKALSAHVTREADPFGALDIAFYRLFDSENGGFYRAADRYALQPGG